MLYLLITTMMQTDAVTAMLTSDTTRIMRLDYFNQYLNSKLPDYAHSRGENEKFVLFDG